MDNNFSEVSWDDIRLEVKKLAPSLFDAIERLSPDKSFRLFRARYSYGKMIVADGGIFNIPHGQDLLPLNDSSIPNDIKEALSYNWFGIPMSLILNGQVDLFNESRGKIETAATYCTANMLALRGVLDPRISYQARSIWRISSGSRTPLMIPSISDKPSFNKLRKIFKLTSNKPQNQTEHWQLFSELANHEDFKTPWHADLLLFSKKWLEPQDSDAWKLFHRELLMIAWKASAYNRNINPVNRIWTNFITSLSNKRATGYVLNTLKHIIEASLGQAPLYGVFDGDINKGPFEEITKIFVDVYGLSQYAPIIMLPEPYNSSKNKPGYVSFKFLTKRWPGKLSFDNTSLMSNTREIYYLLKQFLDQISLGQIAVNDTPFSGLLDLDINFYHYTRDADQDLLPSVTVFDGDPDVSKLVKQYNLTQIPNSPKNMFLSSCVKIQNKK